MIQEYENSLRSIISFILGEGDDAHFKVTPERIASWKTKREIEEKKFKGVLFENRIIFYSDFYDLETIISKNWDKFTVVFGERKRFEVFFKEVENFRNTVSHSRTLMPYQEKMLDAVVSDLKTKITLYHNKNEIADDYFIRIIKVSDSLGNIWTTSNLMWYVSTGKTLRVGDTIEFNIEAFDPKGNEIIYSISKGVKIIEENNTGKFSLTVKKEWIATLSLLSLEVKTNEPEYQNKKEVSFGYTILPSII